jgi:hypothetical protein
MSEGRSSASILFVGDEPSIRLTLPPILSRHCTEHRKY